MKKAKIKSQKPAEPGSEAKYPLRVLLPAALLGVLAVAASFDYYGASARYQQSNTDPYRIAEQLERFRPAIGILPPSSVVGYLSDLPVSGMDGRAAFLSAQYTLAPRLLVEAGAGPPPRLAIGNFSHPQDFAAAGRPLGLHVDRDLGNGVVLFSRVGN